MAESPEIDFTKMDFPSDGLTIKAIRQRWPQAVDTRKDDPYSDVTPRPLGPPAGEMLHNMLRMERDLAKATFGLEFGREPDIAYADHDVKLLAEDLSELYITFGVASGQHHASQLIRSIESQATAQTRQHIPPRP
jgi:hypothetical protein